MLNYKIYTDYGPRTIPVPLSDTTYFFLSSFWCGFTIMIYLKEWVLFPSFLDSFAYFIFVTFFFVFAAAILNQFNPKPWFCFPNNLIVESD